jgi:hypothetical protein
MKQSDAPQASITIPPKNLRTISSMTASSNRPKPQYRDDMADRDQSGRNEPGGARTNVADECGNAMPEATLRYHIRGTATVSVYRYTTDPAAGG